MWFEMLLIFDNLTRERRGDAENPVRARMT
jgi:hypothetical protein